MFAFIIRNKIRYARKLTSFYLFVYHRQYDFYALFKRCRKSFRKLVTYSPIVHNARLSADNCTVCATACCYDLIIRLEVQVYGLLLSHLYDLDHHGLVSEPSDNASLSPMLATELGMEFLIISGCMKCLSIRFRVTSAVLLV